MVHRILAQAVVNCAAQEKVIKSQQRLIVDLKQKLSSHRRKSQTQILKHEKKLKAKAKVTPFICGGTYIFILRNMKRHEES